MRIDKTPKKFFSHDEAEKVAAKMTADEHENGGDWAYVPVHDPKGTGFSFVEVIDGDGEKIANL